MQDWLQPSRLRVIGLDLAWSEDNPSGVSVLEWDGRSARLTQETRADLGDNRAVLHFVSNVAGDGPCVIAVDCPLAVPNAKGRRVCDALVSRHFRAYDAGTHPANRELFVAKKRLRGERLAKALRRSGFSLDPRTQASNQVIEVYPHPAIVSLFGLDLILKYKGGRKRTIEFRREELGRLRGYLNGLGTANPPFAIDDPVLHESLDDLRGRRFKQVEDALDSLVCAYTGLLYGLYGPHRCAIFGDMNRGHIVIPMSDTMWRRIGSPFTPDILFLGDLPPNA